MIMKLGTFDLKTCRQTAKLDAVNFSELSVQDLSLKMITIQFARFRSLQTI